MLTASVLNGLVQREFSAQIPCGCDWSKRKKKGQDAVVTGDCDRCGNTGKVTERVTRWCRVEPFLPGELAAGAAIHELHARGGYPGEDR